MYILDTPRVRCLAVYNKLYSFFRTLCHLQSYNKLEIENNCMPLLPLPTFCDGIVSLLVPAILSQTSLQDTTKATQQGC